MNRTRWVLLLVLMATLIAAWLAPPAEDPADVALSPRARDQVSRPQAQPAVAPGNMGRAAEKQPGREPSGRESAGSAADKNEAEVLVIRARFDEEDSDPLSDLFASPAWARKAPPSAPEAAGPQDAVADPPAPTAPPLPFTVIGSMNEGGQPKYFLRYAERSFVIQVGDTLLEQYRVEAIEGSKLMLRYLPLDQLQSLELGNPS